jgi:hypothetical protein
MARGRSGQCLNRPARVAMTSATKMPPWYDAPRLARVRVGPRTDPRSAVCTAHVRRDGGEARGVPASRHRGAREPWEGARPQSARSLGKARRPDAECDNPPRKIPYYRLNQSTLVIKQQ